MTPLAENMEQLNNVNTHHVLYEVIIFPAYHSQQHPTQYKWYHSHQYQFQQHPDLVVSIGRPWSIFTLFVVSAADEGGPTLFLISAAIVMNACSTFVAFLADVSKNGIPSWSAYSWNHCQVLIVSFQPAIHVYIHTKHNIQNTGHKKQ